MELETDLGVTVLNADRLVCRLGFEAVRDSLKGSLIRCGCQRKMTLPDCASPSESLFQGFTRESFDTIREYQMNRIDSI